MYNKLTDKEEPYMNKEAFAKNLKELRLQSGMTQTELGNRLYVSKQAVSKWETGKAMPDIDLLVDIAKIFNVSVDYITGEQGIKQDDKKSKKTDKKKIFIIVTICLIAVLAVGLGVYFGLFYDKDDSGLQGEPSIPQDTTPPTPTTPTTPDLPSYNHEEIMALINQRLNVQIDEEVSLYLSMSSYEMGSLNKTSSGFIFVRSDEKKILKYETYENELLTLGLYLKENGVYNTAQGDTSVLVLIEQDSLYESVLQEIVNEEYYQEIANTSIEFDYDYYEKEPTITSLAKGKEYKYMVARDKLVEYCEYNEEEYFANMQSYTTVTLYDDGTTKLKFTFDYTDCVGASFAKTEYLYEYKGDDVEISLDDKLEKVVQLPNRFKQLSGEPSLIVDGEVKVIDIPTDEEEFYYLSGKKIYSFDGKDVALYCDLGDEFEETSYFIGATEEYIYFYNHSTIETYTHSGSKVYTTNLRSTGDGLLGIYDNIAYYYTSGTPAGGATYYLVGSIYAVELATGIETTLVDTKVDGDGGVFLFNNDILYYKKESYDAMEYKLVKIDLDTKEEIEISSDIRLRQMMDVPKLGNEYVISHDKVYSLEDYSLVEELPYVSKLRDIFGLNEIYDSAEYVFEDCYIREGKMGFTAAGMSIYIKAFGVYDKEYGVMMEIIPFSLNKIASESTSSATSFSIGENGFGICFVEEDDEGNTTTNIYTTLPK